MSSLEIVTEALQNFNVHSRVPLLTLSQGFAYSKQRCRRVETCFYT